MNNEEIPYIGPASVPYVEKEELTEGQAKDERDLSTLEKVRKLYQNRREYYQSVDSLDIKGGELTVKQQLALHKKLVFHLQEAELLIDRGIKEVKERNNG